MNVPANLRYTKSHEWIRLEGSVAYIGITDYAQDTLGDLVYIELPDKDRRVVEGEELTTIESVKAAEPIYSPLEGTIVEVNQQLDDSPELINAEPYEAFIFAVELTDPSSVGTLLSSDEYIAFVENETES